MTAQKLHHVLGHYFQESGMKIRWRNLRRELCSCVEVCRKLRSRKPAGARDCISQVAKAAHSWRLLRKAFAIVTSFLATAVMMTMCGFAALRRQSAKYLRLGL